MFFYWIKSKKLFFIEKNIQLKQFFNNWWIDDLFISSVIWVLVWWRLGHVLYNMDYYIQNPIEVFYIWKWWMAFVWWVIGVIIALLWIKRKYKLSLSEILVISDLIVLILPLAIFFGRIANFLNQELYGRPINELWALWSIFLKTWLTWKYEMVDNLKRVNTNFIEAVFEGLVIWIVNLILFIRQIFKNKYFPWFISGIFLFLYGIFRFVAERLRDYSGIEFVLYLTKTQWLMIVFVILGLYLVLKSKKIYVNS